MMSDINSNNWFVKFLCLKFPSIKLFTCMHPDLFRLPFCEKSQIKKIWKKSLSTIKRYLFNSFVLVYKSLITKFTNMQMFTWVYQKVLIQVIHLGKLFVYLYVSEDVYSSIFSLKTLCYKFHKHEAFPQCVSGGGPLSD